MAEEKQTGQVKGEERESGRGRKRGRKKAGEHTRHLTEDTMMVTRS